jgi:hypothetical protein
MIDIIGDIHGYAEKLKELLKKLGYSFKDGIYSHTNRTALFVGDYIDRGLQIVETLKIVKSMVDNGNAIALMGNHEFNAICFNFQDKKGGHLRKHEIKNIIQHYETLKQFQNKQSEYDSYINWFKTLPLFYETEQFRAVHACWDNQSIEYLRTKLNNDRLTDELIYESVKKDSELYYAIDVTLKGKEIKLPENSKFSDKDGTERKEIRIKWWEDPSQSSYSCISIIPDKNLSNLSIDKSSGKNFEINDSNYYKENEMSVFFGHYWLKGEPILFRDNIGCLDYSVANEGKLSAYRFDGEKILDSQKFVYV